MEKCKVSIWNEKFAIIKSKKVYPNAFANIIDKHRNEITVIIDQTKFNENYVVEIEKNYRLLTFDAVLSFDSVGFIAKISKALADEEIPVLVISAFSTGHIIVKENYLEKTKKKLESLGFVIEELKW